MKGEPDRVKEQRRRWGLRRSLLGMDDDEADGGLGEGDAEEVARRIEAVRGGKAGRRVEVTRARDPGFAREVE